MRILFVMAHSGYARNFESTVRSLADRGHHVHVACDRESHIPSDDELLEGLRSEFPHVTVGRTPLRDLVKHDPRSRGSVALRRGLDYVRYFDPSFRDASKLRRRAAEKAPRFVQVLTGSNGSRLRLRVPLRVVLRGLERAMPPAPEIVSYLEGKSPDVLLVTPLVELGSPQVDYIRAARALGIPVVYPVASWDNLTTKGLIHEQPDVVVVWNEAQRNEAVSLHRVPPERVAVTGAGAYDHWFSWKPSTTRDEFCARVGLPDDAPFVLYLGSSGFIAPDEQRHVVEWLRRLRESPEVADLPVLIRPHPTNPLVLPTGGDELSQLVQADAAATVYPPAGANPTTDASRRDYFDSIFHAAVVVGVNTSALIESAIIGRPVLTLRSGDFRETQEGTLHFHHLADAISGTSTTYAEHFAHVRAAVDGTLSTERVEAFVRRFIRPHGLDAPATPHVVEVVERTARGAERRPRRVARPSRALAAIVSEVGRADRRRAARPSVGMRAKPPGAHLRILFVLHYPGYLRYYDSTLAALAERGHTIQVCFESLSKQSEGLEALHDASPAIHVLEAELGARRAHQRRMVRGIRRVGNYLHYLDPAFADATFLRGRARSRLPRVLRPLGWIDTLPRWLVRWLQRLLVAFENALPLDRRMLRLLRELRPDVVVASPLIVGVSAQTDLLQAAGAVGIPRALAVASWDHLTTKGVVRVLPERVFVWNDLQRAEARSFHRVPDDHIVVTGAPAFDKWFDRRPSTSRDAFCRRVGLDPAREFVLFVGSTASISPSEPEQRFVREWIGQIRGSADPRLADIGVLVRPHPYNSEPWADVDLAAEGIDNAVVWPRSGANPVSDEDRTDYFDSLFHAVGVIGINTSAMIEAAIVGRPVFTVTSDEFAATQNGTLHFQYLLSENGGFLRVARTVDEHLEQLVQTLDGASPVGPTLQAFVQRFVRPLGLERSATEELANAIEATARLTVSPPRPSRILRFFWTTVFRRIQRRAERRASRHPLPEPVPNEQVGTPWN
jgi:hypothetical protein